MASHRWGAVLVLGLTLHWMTFHSRINDFTIQQPSNYTHVVLRDAQHHLVDYFFPALGDSVTNVNIYKDGDPGNAARDLRSSGAHNVHRDGYLRIMGRRYPLIYADFKGMTESWTEEQVVIRLHGRVWHLTASFATRFESQAKIMLHILESFHTG